MNDHRRHGGWRWVIGVVLLVQGFGSAITESQWDTSFGVAGVLRAIGLPQWSDLIIGAAGVALLVWAAARTEGRRTDG
jgi:hypothetical protein